MLEAKLNAEGEFKKYRVIQDREYESDFDKAVKKLEGAKPTNKKFRPWKQTANSFIRLFYDQ